MGLRSSRDEADTCRDLIVPMLRSAGWTDELIREQYPLRADRVLSAGITSRRLGDGRADYVLEATPGLPVAVLEAKREYKIAADGLQQAIRYAQQLDVPIAYASNGRQIIERNLRTGTERFVESAGTPAELWAEWVAFQGLNDETAELPRQSFNRNRTSITGEVITPRWYQTVAVHRVLRALATEQRRILLLMATGTGKTFTAMQIVEKLRSYHRLRHPDRNYRVLYLADRDWLLSQPMAKDFAPAFGGEPLHRVRGGANLSRELYFATYQALSGADDTEALFHDYPPNFFDLVIVDECHRGSASQDSTWRRVLDHFASAAQLGLTATPKRDATTDSYTYFGNPVFAYSLRDGIEDGYLAPYRVRRVVLSPDADGWVPTPGERDRLGRDIPDGIYSTRDFERVVSLLMRTRVAARHLSRLLPSTKNARTMVFCVDSQHAEDMRAALAAENPDRMASDPEWVVRIVGDEPERERLLERFTDPESSSPTVATTSKLLSTGIDVEDLAYVVLFRPVGSMVEFKQIIGRGTRLYPENGKTSFEIIDYVGATQKFDDPDFDGYPAAIIEQVIDEDGEPIEPAHDVDSSADSSASGPASPSALGYDHGVEGGTSKPTSDVLPYSRKLYVDDGDFGVTAEATYMPDTSTGNLHLTEYGEYVRDQVRSIAASPGDLASRWTLRPGREAILAELDRYGVRLADLDQNENASGRDVLDVLIQLAWNQPAPTRAERARRVRIEHREDIARGSVLAQNVLGCLLDRYANYGVDDITSGAVLQVEPFTAMGSPIAIAREFGGADGWHAQLDELQRWLYSA
jgi:type I restriction enzyme R subunit